MGYLMRSVLRLYDPYVSVRFASEGYVLQLKLGRLVSGCNCCESGMRDLQKS